MLMHLFFTLLFAPKRRKYAIDAQTKIAFAILLALPQQKRFGMEEIMFRLWGKVFHENHLIRDIVVENNHPNQTRTAKVFAAIDEICQTFDFSHPLWLDSNIAEFKRHAKTRFTQDNFVDNMEFDFLEIHVIEED